MVGQLLTSSRLQIKMSKNKFELIYAIAIIIAVPAIIVINTIYLGNQAREDFVTEARRKADIVNQSVAISAKQLIKTGNTESLNGYLDEFSDQSPTLKDVYVAGINDDSIDIIASNKEGYKLSDHQEQSINFAIETCKTIVRNKNELQSVNSSESVKIDCPGVASKGVSYDNNGNKTNTWEVTTPVLNEDYDIVAVAASTITTADADELLDNTFFRSYIFLAISVLIVVALLVHHFKLAGYSQLLAKQKEINQTLSDFLSVATHELKAPTSIIKGYISNVTDGTFGEVSKDVKAQLFVALNQTDRLNSLVQDLLNVSRVEQGRIQYEITTVDLNATIGAIVENYRANALEKNIVLIYKPEGVSLVKADAGRAQEIFTNLIDNSIKYTPSGSVTITHEANKQYLITKIRDTGLGISAENRKRLFQRFYRVQTEQTKTISGTGLGLWIIKQYIEAMGGKIEVDSLVGSGTEFIVYLPINK